jgi:dihydroorotase
MDSAGQVTILRDVLLPGGRIADVTLKGGVVSHVGASGHANTVVKCSDLIVIPAGIDMHVHMRDGVQGHKEDWESGTRSALAGGVTVVIDQPNTIPPIITPGLFLDRVHLASKKSYCHFGINGAVTKDADLNGMSKAGITAFGETFAGPSSYGDAISKQELQNAMDCISRLKGLITIHAEIVSEGDDKNLFTHDHLRPAGGEQKAVSLIRSITPPGLRIHYCHISSAQTISDIKGHRAGTVEVTPHHLFLTYESFLDADTRVKVNPPLRTETERKKLWTCWDMIDVIASDHAPHTGSEKSVPFNQAPSGIPGVETMIPLLMAEVLSGRISLPHLIEKTSLKPAEILGIPAAGFNLGMRADFSLYPRKPELIDIDRLSSKAGWTPYEGMQAVFPEQVIMSGIRVYDQGTCIKSEPKWIRGRGYNPGA